MRYASLVGVIQVRGVSDDVHRRLKARAAMRGQSLTDYLRMELELLGSLPTLEELNERVASRAAVGGEPGADAVRAGRADRERRQT